MVLWVVFATASSISAHACQMDLRSVQQTHQVSASVTNMGLRLLRRELPSGLPSGETPLASLTYRCHTHFCQLSLEPASPVWSSIYSGPSHPVGFLQEWRIEDPDLQVPHSLLPAELEAPLGRCCLVLLVQLLHALAERVGDVVHAIIGTHDVAHIPDALGCNCLRRLQAPKHRGMRVLRLIAAVSSESGATAIARSGESTPRLSPKQTTALSNTHFGHAVTCQLTFADTSLDHTVRLVAHAACDAVWHQHRDAIQYTDHHANICTWTIQHRG